MSTRPGGFQPLLSIRGDTVASMAIGYHAAFLPASTDEDRRLRLALDWLSSEDVAESQERLVETRSQALLRRVRALMRDADNARLVTERTAHNRWWSGGPLLLVEPTDRFFHEWIDDHRPTAMCVVPGTGLEIEAWARASRAINFADPQAEVAKPELDPVAAEGLAMLTKPALVNITSLSLDEDKARIVLVLEELRKAAVPFVAWYRNPGSATPASLRIAYQNDADEWSSLQPDFVIVSRRDDGSLAASIVDPHGDHLGDARAKLHALADFVERFSDRFVRVESVAQSDGGALRVLDLTHTDVRAPVKAFEGAKMTALYQSDVARPYP